MNDNGFWISTKQASDLLTDLWCIRPVNCYVLSTYRKPFNSHKWLICSFSLQYLYINQQISIESTQTYQVEVVILISHQILVTN